MVPRGAKFSGIKAGLLVQQAALKMFEDMMTLGFYSLNAEKHFIWLA
jgi:hypothetical protein